MRQLSEQSEQSEPLLHKNLYDAVRKAQTSGLEENLQETRDQLRYGSAVEAKDAERKAANAVDELQKGVEKAAESVLGSESEALRVAKNELDKLIKEAQEQQGGQKGQEGQAADNKAGEQTLSPKETADASKSKAVRGSEPAPDTKAESASPRPGEGKQNDPQRGVGQPPAPKMAEAGQKPGEGQGKGQQAGQGSGEGQPQTADANHPNPSGRGRSRSNDRKDNSQMAGGPTRERDSDNDRSRPQIQGGALSEALFFEDAKEQPDTNVFTGDGYDRWSDRLRNVEELLNNPELRNEAAKVLDRARELRINLKRSNEAPQVAVLNTRITQPLIELRDRVAEELSKKDTGKNLAPVDRDPVPAEFRDLVKRYYQELGAGK
jgi:hypothetical protein